MFCNKCGKEIPNDSRVCKFCGNPVSQTTNITGNATVNRNNVKVKKQFYQKAWFWILIVFAFIVFVGIIGSSSDNTNIVSSNPTNQEQEKTNNTNTTTQEEEKEDNVMKVDYEELHQEYMDNPIAADAKYKGKILELTGEVYTIDREIAGNPYITFNIGGEYSFQDVRITFKKSEEEKVTKLKKGQEVTIRGECRGTLLSTTVSLDDCEIVE